MKKILAVVLALVLIVSLAACSGGNSSEENAPAATAEAPEPGVEIDADGNVTYNIAYSNGKYELCFTFDGNKLKSAEGVITIYDKGLFDKVAGEVGNYNMFFESVESDDTALTCNIKYSKAGMEACSFTDKTPEELAQYLKDFVAGTESGRPINEAKNIALGIPVTTTTSSAAPFAG